MSGYFDASGNRISAGSLARGSQVNALRDEAGAGFDKLPTEADIKNGLIHNGAESGAANAYVVTMTYTPTAYTDGMKVIFKAGNANTGASTVNVDSLGAKSITRADGAALAAGDIQAGKFTEISYNSTSGMFEIQRLVAGEMADVSTVAGIAADVTAVAGVSADVSTVAGIAANVTSVAGIASAVAAVAGITAAVSAVAGVTAAVTAVAGIVSAVSVVAGIAANVQTVAGISANVTTVAANDADVSTCATNISAILAAPAAASSASGSASAAGVSEGNAADSETAAAASAAVAAGYLAQRKAVKFYLAPSRWPEIVKVLHPGNFNQQWGGANLPITLPSGEVVDIATGYVKGSAAVEVGVDAATYYRYMIFNNVLAQTSLDVSVLASKVGNPTDNTVFHVFAVSGNTPTGTSLANTSISNKLLPTNRAWTPPKTITYNFEADTQYALVVTRSGALDASNYINLTKDSVGTYPFGNAGSGTSAPVWTPITTQDLAFIVIPPATSRFLRSGGMFNKMLALGSTRNMVSKFTLDRYINTKGHCSVPIYATLAAADKNKTIFDVGVAPDRSRIRLATTAAGYLTVEIYDSSGTNTTITGTTDVCDGVGRLYTLRFRAVGDAADHLSIFAGATEQGTGLTAQTFAMDERLKNKHFMLGWGWGAAPAWTSDADDCSVLPSHTNNGSHSWVGTGVEANCFAAQGAYWRQVASGYASTDYGYYQKITNYSNSTGWTTACGVRVLKNDSAIGTETVVVRVQDSAKRLKVTLFPHFLAVSDGTNWYSVACDLKTDVADLIFTGKGSDFSIYHQGKLLFDGTGLLQDATPGVVVYFGDINGTAGENADVEWYYFKYYAGLYVPDELSASYLHEVATIERQVDTTFLNNLFNDGGTPKSLKEYLGLGANYFLAGGYAWSQEYKGITNNPTTVLTTYTEVPEMGAFSLGFSSISGKTSVSNSSLTANLLVLKCNGIEIKGSEIQVTTPVANFSDILTTNVAYSTSGLSYPNLNWKVGGGTATAKLDRTFTLEGV